MTGRKEMAFGLKLPLLVITTLSLLQCSPAECHGLKLITLQDKYHGNPRSRGWFDARETDEPTIVSASKIFPNVPEFYDGLAMSNRPQRTLLSGQELHPRGVVTNRYLSAPGINHKVPFYVAKRSRARTYIGRRSSNDAVYVERRAAVGDGKGYVAIGEYGGDGRGKVPVNRIPDRIMEDDKDNGGETGIQDSVGLADLIYNDGLKETAHDCRGLKTEHGETDRALGINDNDEKEISVRRGGTADGKSSNRKLVSVQGVPMLFGGSGKLRNEAKEKRSRSSMVPDFASYLSTGFDPTVSANRKRRSLWFDFENANSLPWATAEYQPPDWKGHYREVDPYDLEKRKRQERNRKW